MMSTDSRNFARALTPPGWIYFTVELTSTKTLDAAFAEGQRLNLPVVYVAQHAWLH